MRALGHSLVRMGHLMCESESHSLHCCALYVLNCECESANRYWCEHNKFRAHDRGPRHKYVCCRLPLSRPIHTLFSDSSNCCSIQVNIEAIDHALLSSIVRRLSFTVVAGEWFCWNCIACMHSDIAHRWSTAQ